MALRLSLLRPTVSFLATTSAPLLIRRLMFLAFRGHTLLTTHSMILIFLFADQEFHSGQRVEQETCISLGILSMTLRYETTPSFLAGVVGIIGKARIRMAQ